MTDPTISFIRHNWPKEPSTGKFSISESGFVTKDPDGKDGSVEVIDGRYVITVSKFDEALIEKVCRCFNLKRDKVRVIARNLR